MKFTFVFSALFAALSVQVDARTQRSSVERHAFVKANACPDTGRHRLPCPGWQIDHVRPLCSGGPDAQQNMQWLTIADHKVKTRVDVRACRTASQMLRAKSLIRISQDDQQ